jgi:hypothetical protein
LFNVVEYALLVCVVSAAFFKCYYRGRSFPPLYSLQTQWGPVSTLSGCYLSLSGGRCLSHYATILEVPGSIPCRVLGNFHVTSSFCPHSVVLGFTQPLTEMTTRKFSWGKVRSATRADNTALPVVPTVKVRMEAQLSIPPLSFHYLLRKVLPYTCRCLYVKQPGLQFVTLYIYVAYLFTVKRSCVQEELPFDIPGVLISP